MRERFIPQACHCRSPCRGQVKNLCPLFAPAEVLVPTIDARIEEGGCVACLGIEPCTECQLKPVAAHAGETQVVYCRGAAQRLGDDVVDLHLHDDRLRRQAVFTASARPLDYLLAQRWRDVRHLGPARQRVVDTKAALLEHEESLRAVERYAISVLD